MVAITTVATIDKALFFFFLFLFPWALLGCWVVGLLGRWVKAAHPIPPHPLPWVI